MTAFDLNKTDQRTDFNAHHFRTSFRISIKYKYHVFSTLIQKFSGKEKRKNSLQILQVEILSTYKYLHWMGNGRRTGPSLVDAAAYLHSHWPAGGGSFWANKRPLADNRMRMANIFFSLNILNLKQNDSLLLK